MVFVLGRFATLGITVRSGPLNWSLVWRWAPSGYRRSRNRRAGCLTGIYDSTAISLTVANHSESSLAPYCTFIGPLSLGGGFPYEIKLSVLHFLFFYTNHSSSRFFGTAHPTQSSCTSRHWPFQWHFLFFIFLLLSFFSLLLQFFLRSSPSNMATPRKTAGMLLSVAFRNIVLVFSSGQKETAL